jgi:hypothetical protein
MNFGLRYDFTQPPTNMNDEYSDFNPTKPNPGADGYPGALWFAGNGAGREGTRSLVPGWYAGIAPRLSLAYAPDNKTTIRTGFGRSFARVTAVQGSGHSPDSSGSINLTTHPRVCSRRSGSMRGFPPTNCHH